MNYRADPNEAWIGVMRCEERDDFVTVIMPMQISR
jgi:hypothetical protein